MNIPNIEQKPVDEFNRKLELFIKPDSKAGRAISKSEAGMLMSVYNDVDKLSRGDKRAMANAQTHPVTDHEAWEYLTSRYEPISSRIRLSSIRLLSSAYRGLVATPGLLFLGVSVPAIVSLIVGAAFLPALAAGLTVAAALQLLIVVGNYFKMGRVRP